METVGTTKTVDKSSYVRDLCYVAVCAALMAICSWLSIAVIDPPFTLQTMGLFLTVGLLGGRRGTLAVLVYILLGALGLPVFANFTGGIGILLSATGGYIVGFLFSALAMWGMERLLGRKPWALILSMVLAMVIYFTFGTFWYMQVYMRTTGPVGLLTVLGWCVFPFIVPDLLKMALAFTITLRVRQYVR